MFKLNTFTVAIAAALALGAHAVEYNLTADINICNGELRTYSCAGSANLPPPPLGNVPTFNLVIGFPNTSSPSSPNCGDCYQLTYVTPTGESRVRTVTVVNDSPPPRSANLCETVFRNLTGITGPLPEFGTIRADLVEQPRAACGL